MDFNIYGNLLEGNSALFGFEEGSVESIMGKSTMWGI
jgi:hypothetical protein